MRLKPSFGIPMKSRVTTQPAPVKGLNAYDSIVGMSDGFALVLRNLYAQPYGCQVRRGYVRHATGLDGPVETVMSHNAGTPHLYAFSKTAAAASLYDVTAPNTDAPTAILDDLTNARWQHINFPNAAGVHLIAVNGEDDPIWVNPSNVVARILDTDITGVDPALFVDVYSHQKRLWFVEKDTTYAWYLPPDQLVGAATEFNPGINWTRGGYLNQIITWTIDDGNGADDHIAFISSEGEVSIYQGIDPSGADTWALQGVYYAGAPVGRRCACRYGGDIKIVTQHGVVNLSDLLKSTKVNPTEGNDGRFVQQLISAAATEDGSLFGWQPFVFPAANMFMVNVPITETTSFQFVMNDITKAWSEFIGYEANCWELHQQLPFYGGFGAVYRAWEQYTDDAVVNSAGVVTPGAQIRSEAQSAFSYFGNLGTQKHFKMVRPTILSRGTFSLNLSANMDFIFDSPVAPGYFSARRIGRWDEDLWDSAVWSGGLSTYKNWLSVTGIGTAAAIRLLLRTDSETYWATTDWLFEIGGVM